MNEKRFYWYQKFGLWNKIFAFFINNSDQYDSRDSFLKYGFHVKRNIINEPNINITWKHLYQSICKVEAVFPYRNKII